MNDCQYNQLNDPEDTLNTEKCHRKYIGRQVLVNSTVWVSYLTFGLMTGAPTVTIPQIRREANNTEIITENMASWLSSAIGYGGLPWVFILPILAAKYGRRLPNFITHLISLIAFLVFYVSTNPTHLLISSILTGISITNNMSSALMIGTECSTPKYRGVFLTIKTAICYWGIWISNAVGTFLHWRTIGIFGIVTTGYAVIASFWIETPYWYATVGKFDKCIKQHRWLKGHDKESEKELHRLINSQKEILDQDKNENVHRNIFQDKLKLFREKEFYKPVLLSMVLMASNHTSGKLACNVYAIQIIKKITDSEHAAYRGMLIMDGITVAAMYFGCYLAKILKRRTLLITSGTSGAIFLFVLSLYLYLIKLRILNENEVLSILLLTGFAMSISVGPTILSTSIYAEIIPMKFKSIALLVTTFYIDILISTVLVIAPHMFKQLGTHGAFFVYGICTTFCITVLYIYLPETKDKTLLEIEESFIKV